MNRIAGCAALFLIVAVFFSCASNPERRIDSVYVMVYDYENAEVMDADVFMGEKKVGKTNRYGRIVIPAYNGKEETVVVKIEKEGYETVSMETRLCAGQVLYFKTGTAAYYAMRAETLLDEGNVHEALLMIERSLKIQERADYLFLRDVIQRRSKP